MQTVAQPRWLKIGVGLSLLLAVLLVAGARGLQMRRHYVDLGSDVRICLDDAGLSLYTHDTYGPYRGRSLSFYDNSEFDDNREVFGFDLPVHFRHIRWWTGRVEWMLTIDLPLLLFGTSILPLVSFGWQIRNAWRNSEPKRSWSRFSIRTLLLMFLMLGLGLGLRGHSRAQSRIADQFDGRGARLDWDCTDTPQSSVIWLLFGDNLYDDIFGVHFQDDSISAADIDSLQRFPNLIYLKFTNCTLSDGALQRLGNLPRLRNLTIAGSKANEAELSQLSKLQSLDSLTITANPK